MKKAEHCESRDLHMLLWLFWGVVVAVAIVVAVADGE